MIKRFDLYLNTAEFGVMHIADVAHIRRGRASQALSSGVKGVVEKAFAC